MTQYLVALRKNTESGVEWFDTSSMSLDAEQSQKWNRENEQKLPDFYKAHPLVRFAWVTLQEIKA